MRAAQRRGRAAAHGLHQGLDRGRLGRAVADERAIAQHHDRGCDVDDLMQLVADENDGDAVGRLGMDEGAQLPAALRVERGGRLVENEHAHMRRGRGARDLHHLTMADRKILDRAVDLDAIAGEDEVERCARAVPVGAAPARQRSREIGRFEKEILGDRQIAAERQLLMDDADAMRLRVAGTETSQPRAARQDPGARIRPDDAAEQAHQRALAGAVAAHEPEHIARRHDERDVSLASVEPKALVISCSATSGRCRRLRPGGGRSLARIRAAVHALAVRPRRRLSSASFWESRFVFTQSCE